MGVQRSRGMELQLAVAGPPRQRFSRSLYCRTARVRERRRGRRSRTGRRRLETGYVISRQGGPISRGSSPHQRRSFLLRVCLYSCVCVVSCGHGIRWQSLCQVIDVLQSIPFMLEGRLQKGYLNVGRLEAIKPMLQAIRGLRCVPGCA